MNIEIGPNLQVSLNVLFVVSGICVVVWLLVTKLMR
jgi:hypothetical protein